MKVLRSHPFCSTAFLATLLAAASAADAAERQARFTVDVRVQGSESAKASSDWSKSTISERFHVTTIVKTDGVLSSVNMKDPEYAQKAVAQAARAQQRIRATQQNLAEKGVGPKPVDPNDAEALMKEMHDAIAACGDNETCKQAAGMKYATQPGFAAAMAALSQPEYACKQHSGGDAAREAQCLQAYGITPGAAPEDFDPDEEEAPPDERYMTYIGWIGCPTEIAIKVDNRNEGAYADVAGMIAYVSTDTAEWKGTDIDRTSLCVGYTTVVDTKDDRIYTDGGGFPQVQGTSVYREPGRREDQRFEGTISALPSAAAQFVHDTLRVATLSGTKRATLKLDRPYMVRPPIAEYSGQIDVEVTWKFEPL